MKCVVMLPSPRWMYFAECWDVGGKINHQEMLAAGPVSRILSAGKLPLAGDHVPQDGHSSRPRIATRLKRPTRRFGAPSQHAPVRSLRSEARLPPYLVLLRVGFAMPAPLLERRCALTAPFHPYPDVAAKAVYFLWHFPSAGLETSFPDVIRHTALWSSDFPPSSLDAARATVRSSCLPRNYIR
jgi:hypothetical protein